MPGLDPILPHVLPLMLVVIRVTGLFMFTPMLSSGSVPVKFRALLAFTFALALYPFVPPLAGAFDLDLVGLAPLIFAELMIGAAMGLVASLPLLAVQMGGYVMGYQIGLSLAESFNPELESNGSVTGDLLFYMAAFIFIASGGLDVLFVILADSFRTAPVGAFGAGDAPVGLVLAVLGSGFELAIRVATPVMAVVSMLLLSTGFVMKTMPQINIMSIGFAAQILAGLTILLFALGTIATVSGDEISDTLDLLARWVRSLSGAVMGGVGGAPHG